MSESFLRETAERVRSSWPALEVRPVVGDMTRSLRLPEGLPAPLLVALLGSTVGNFEGEAAVGLLREIAGLLGEGDAFLLGADLRPGEGKTTEELEAAYDDAQGVTAEFNRNILRVLNRRAGTDFDPGAFAHEALYRAGEGRIEMHLRPVRPMEVRLPPGRTFRLSPEETIRTEISCKYDRPTLEGLLEAAGLRILRWTTDPRGRYAVLLAGPAGE